MVSYRLEMVSEVREWLHELRRTDRTTARLVGQAITALLEEGPSLGRHWWTGSRARTCTT
jgi:hypothetical protein